MSRKESKLKLFIENMLFYGGLSMLTKALPFITLPIVTRLLTNSSTYGISDMFNVMSSLGATIAIMGLYDGIFREFFEKKDDIEYQRKVTATGLNLVLISSTLTGMMIFIFRYKISILLFKNIEYSNLISISSVTVFFMAISSILGAPTRMRNLRKVYLFTGISFPLLGFVLTILFIKNGYTYEALIYSTLGMSVASAIIFLFLNNKYFSFKILDKKIAKELYKIGLPLLPTFLIYWIFNSMDRVMISQMIGAKELGIYSVGSKVASISQLIYTAFAGGWQYFSFSTMKDENQVEVNSKIFQYLGIISVLAYIVAQPFIKSVFSLFFKGDFVQGYKVFGFLFLSPLMLMLFQILGNQLLIIKKTWICTFTLFLGAILNLVLNYYLIPIYGIRGAAISTLFGYIISVITMSAVCLKNNLLKIEKKVLLIFFVLIISIILEFLFLNIIINIIGYIVLLSIILVFCIEELKRLKGGNYVK